MTNTQGNLFEQSSSEPSPEPETEARPADKARLELTPEAQEQRTRDREARTRRAVEAAKKRQDQIDRAAEQGVDLRTHAEINQASAERGLAKAREELDKTTPQPNINN